mgnify:CR=1 FL=1
MFAPLGFVPGITPPQVAAAARRGGWKEAGVPSLDHYMKLGSWFAGTPQLLIEHLKKLEERYPGPNDRATAMAKAAEQLVKDRLLLEEDAKAYLAN